MLDLFAERVADYRATVTRCAAAELATTIAAALHGASDGRRAGGARDSTCRAPSSTTG